MEQHCAHTATGQATERGSVRLVRAAQVNLRVRQHSFSKTAEAVPVLLCSGGIKLSWIQQLSDSRTCGPGSLLAQKQGTGREKAREMEIEGGGESEVCHCDTMMDPCP
ncbi:unnamed protein product [Leuciscus chuanchicus]